MFIGEDILGFNKDNIGLYYIRAGGSMAMFVVISTVWIGVIATVWIGVSTSLAHLYTIL